MPNRGLKIDFVPEGDMLALWNGLPASGGGADITSYTILTAFYAERGTRECVGFDLFDAAKTLTPFLTQARLKGRLCDGELWVSYEKEKDALNLTRNGCRIVSHQTVAADLTAHKQEDGQVVGFTLERAAELLLPHLETWRPWTDEEMAQIQKRMDEHEAALGEHGVKLL